MKIRILSLLAVIFCLFGCNAAMVVNGKVVGIQSGSFIFQDGYLKTQYKADIEPVWSACEKAVADFKGYDTKKDRTISTGKIKTVIADEDVTIEVTYLDKDLTSVSVFSGVAGNRMASRIIQDKIAAHLGAP